MADTNDPDELMLEQAMRYKDPAMVGQMLERINWRLMYGEFGTPSGVWFLG